MYKSLFQSYMKEEPKNAKEKYIFITDYKELANATFALGFKVLLLSRDEENEYTVESFIQYMREIEFKGTFRSDYIYALACFIRKTHNTLKAYFKDEYLTYREDAWNPLKNREFLAKPESKEKLKKTLNNYIKRYEGGSDEQNETVADVLQMLSYKIDYDRDGKEKSRKVRQTVKNLEIILENDSRFAGKIKFNEFSQQTYLVNEIDNRAWSSYDDSELFSILQSDYEMRSRNDYFDAIKNVSMKNKFHPVRELLDSFKWDGKEYIRNLLPDYLGVEDTEYSYQVMRLFMLGAVARVYAPGCKFDYTPIFTGRQGIGKSTFLRLLSLLDEWFNDSLDSLDSDKSTQSLMGSWIIELAELKSLARTAGGVDSVKRFLTATQDKLRLPYERRADVFLRQCVFAGTTNKSDFLQDETGNRRFLIIQTGVNEPTKSLFAPEAMEDIKAAWAEAVHIWKTEKPLLVLPDSCREEAQRLQEDSMADDGKVGIITEYLADKQRTCAIEIWQKALGEQGRPQKWQASEIINIILSLPDWERMKSVGRFGEYGGQKGFQKVSTKFGKNVNQVQPNMEEFIQINMDNANELPFD